MPWPPKVLAGFVKLPGVPSEADFCGPYNKLLYTLFPAESDFTVVPQYLPGTRGSADFIVMFEVLLADKPVLVLELKAPSQLRYASTRTNADLQIRTRIMDVARQSQPLYSPGWGASYFRFYSRLSLACSPRCLRHGNPALLLQGASQRAHYASLFSTPSRGGDRYSTASTLGL